jgi:hypothetical protein
MGPIDSKTYQLRVRITTDERDHLDKMLVERGRSETISDLVREAIGLLRPQGAGTPSALSPKLQDRVERLAVLLKRAPAQVEEACVEGILDLIEAKCEVPLIVMETRLHLKYHNRSDTSDFPWNAVDAPKDTPAAVSQGVDDKPEA